MKLRGFAVLPLLAIGVVSPATGAPCRLCAERGDSARSTFSAVRSDGIAAKTGAVDDDVEIEVETNLNFDRIILGGNGVGSATLSPNGLANTDGDVIELSARAMVATAHIRGEPGRLVEVDLPRTIVLHSTNGGRLILESVTSDLAAIPRLDSGGTLTVRIGGKIRIDGDTDGQFRGEMPIGVRYQ